MQGLSCDIDNILSSRVFEASWSGELNSDITILINLHHRKPVIICSRTKQQQIIGRKRYLCLLLKMRRIWFYRPFKPFSCTSLKMFPTIYFSTALGEYPVILVVPLHKNVSLRPGYFAKSMEQKDQTLAGRFQWLRLFRWRTAPGVTPNTHKHLDLHADAPIFFSFLTDLLNLWVVTAEKIFTTFNAEQDILPLFWKCEKLYFAESIYFFNNQT